MLKALLTALCLAPCLAMAQPQVLVNAIPSGAEFLGRSTAKPPLPDLANADPKAVETGLAAAIAGVIPLAEKNGVTYVCLLSAPGDDALEFEVPPAREKLKLRAKGSSFEILFYKGGEALKSPVSYSLEKPDSDADRTNISFKKVFVSPGWTTADWIYFNLARIQAAAAKAGATQVFLAVSGTGSLEPVAIPGVKEPLMAPTGQAAFSATWYPRSGKSVGLEPQPARHEVQGATDAPPALRSGATLSMR